MKKRYLLYFLCMLAFRVIYAQEEQISSPAAAQRSAVKDSDNTSYNDSILDEFDWDDFAPDEFNFDDLVLDDSTGVLETATDDSIWVFNSTFDDPTVKKPDKPDPPPINLRNKVLLEATYGFNFGFVPGWNETPWSGEELERRTYYIGLKMDSTLGISIPLNDYLKVYNSFYFSIPDDAVFSVKELYFEYNAMDKAFVKAGLFNINWGISRLYPFTNLPARVPKDINRPNPGNALTFRATVPLGIGGFDFLAMTRIGYVDEWSSPKLNEFAYGMKYNLAIRQIDIDTGFLYFHSMPLRFFISMKTTIANTELYSEGLIAVSHEVDNEYRLSGSIGFARDFFKKYLTVTGELFHNGESDSAWWRENTEILKEDIVDLYSGLNAAFGFAIRPDFHGMRIFSQALYTHEQQSMWLVPGISIRPPGGITFSISTPMALGKRTEKGDKSNYYRNNTDQYNRPFSILFRVNYRGRQRYSF